MERPSSLGYHGEPRGPGSRVPRLAQDGALISNSIHSPCSLEGFKVEMVEKGIVHVRCKRLALPKYTVIIDYVKCLGRKIDRQVMVLCMCSVYMASPEGVSVVSDYTCRAWVACSCT